METRSLVMTGVQQMEMLYEAEAALPSDDFVRVKVHSCGICGSDMHAYHGHDPRRVPPLVLGHEAVGWLDQDGKNVPVAVNPLMTCGKCRACLGGQQHLCSERELIGMRVPGAFSPSVMIHQSNLVVLPKDAPLDKVVLAEPLACGVHAVNQAEKHSDIALDLSSVSIVGGGPIGLFIAQVLLLRGVKKLSMIEAHAGRRRVLEKALPEARILAPDQAEGDQDMVFDAVGSGKTRELVSALVRPAGVILHIGLQNADAGLDTRMITLQEVTFLGCYCYTPSEFKAAVNLLLDNKILSGDWLDYRPLAEGARSFAELHNGSDRLKIVLTL